MTRIGALRPERLWRTALRRGFLGGSGPWRAVGVAVLLARGARKAVRREPEVIATERLRVGEGLSVRSVRRRRR